MRWRDKPENREAVRAQKRRWYEKNVERIRLRVRTYRNSNLDRERAREREKKRKEFASQPERVRTRHREWYSTNRVRASAKVNRNLKIRQQQITDEQWRRLINNKGKTNGNDK
jgi:hypothetical protein